MLRWMLAVLPLILIEITGASAALAQGSAATEERYVYHGAGHSSTWVREGQGSSWNRDGRRRIELQLSRGSQVCVTVINAHPVNYSYVLSVAVDTTAPGIPALFGLESLVAAFPSRQPEPAADRLPSGRVATSAARPLMDKLWFAVESLRVLAAEVDSGLKIARWSDRPEDLGEVGSHAAAGYLEGRRRIDALPSSSGHFNDSRLPATLDALLSRARDSVRTMPPADSAAYSLLVQSLAALKEGLLTRRTQIQTAFHTDEAVRLCGVVGVGPTTMVLSITAKDGGYGAGRDVGVAVPLSIEVRPPYQRQVVSVHPLAFVTFASGVPEFFLESDTLRSRVGDEASFRVGTLLNLTLATFGPDRVFAAGLGLGVGLGAQSTVLSDVFIGPLVSYRDDIRLGLGIGGSRFPSQVRGGTVGQPLPPNSGDLGSLTESRWYSAFQLLIVLPGIGL